MLRSGFKVLSSVVSFASTACVLYLHLHTSQPSAAAVVLCSCADNICKTISTHYHVRPTDTLASIAASIYTSIVANALPNWDALDTGWNPKPPAPTFPRPMARPCVILSLQSQLLEFNKQRCVLQAKLHPGRLLAALDDLHLFGLKPTHFLAVFAGSTPLSPPTLTCPYTCTASSRGSIFARSSHSSLSSPDNDDNEDEIHASRASTSPHLQRQ